MFQTTIRLDGPRLGRDLRDMKRGYGGIKITSMGTLAILESTREVSISRTIPLTDRKVVFDNQRWSNIPALWAPLRKPNTLFSPSPQQMLVQYVGQPPNPPTDWIDKPAYENPGMYVIHSEIYENTGMHVRQPEVLSSNVYEKQSLSMFKRQPCIFVVSKENMQSRVEFFTVKQNFELSNIVKNPVILALSLEKRIIPRCNVLEIQYSNGFIGRVNAGLVTSMLTLNEEKFIEKYVTKYQVTVPELVQIGLADFERGRWVLQDVESNETLESGPSDSMYLTVEMVQEARAAAEKSQQLLLNVANRKRNKQAYWNSNSIHLHTFTFGPAMGGDNYGNLNVVAKNKEDLQEIFEIVSVEKPCFDPPLSFSKYDITSEEDFVALGERMTCDYKGGDDQRWRARVLFDFQGPSDIIVCWWDRLLGRLANNVIDLSINELTGDRGLIFMIKLSIMLLLCLWFLNPDVCRMNLHVH
ncbi:hypothetical protein IFM89_018212 [Coptis chinensis]|uniref:Uncharacterized protein n=1 Tax=Coptis chinensis TaxID=261450 RepID=A0A835I371_9MAGN|nr:hypothetical protein IFM89_018212 [Coptis chinensis]